jgi:uncharacterized protein (TIGR02391 family)
MFVAARYNDSSPMAKRSDSKSHSSPTLPAARAVALLREKLASFDRVSKLPTSSPEISKWQNTTLAILKASFGEPHRMVDNFYLPTGPISTGMPDSFFEEMARENMQHMKTIVESSIEQLEVLGPALPIADYQFHPEIERVSGDLFRGNHYKQAALEAYIRVIEEVKQRSGLNLDGDNLMNQAFSFDTNRAPILRFNAMNSDAERDEQRGFMFLFKGIVQHRNYKAHSNRLFDDPSRAHEYLALASLLMRMLEISQR